MMLTAGYELDQTYLKPLGVIQNFKYEQLQLGLAASAPMEQGMKAKHISPYCSSKGHVKKPVVMIHDDRKHVIIQALAFDFGLGLGGSLDAGHMQVCTC